MNKCTMKLKKKVVVMTKVLERLSWSSLIFASDGAIRECLACFIFITDVKS